MKKIKKYSLYIVATLSAILILVTLLSLFYSQSTIWWIKAMNFPREQILVVCVIFAIALGWLIDSWKSWGKVAIFGGLVISTIIQAYFIIPYTPLVSKEVPSISKSEAQQENTVSIILANVYMKNRKSDHFIELVEEIDPDMVLVMETDQWWQRVLKPFADKYPYRMEHPNDETYGMLLYSRYPISDSIVAFLHHDDVPSFHVKVALPSDQKFEFHGIHPVPPTPSKYPDNIGEDGVALKKVAEMVAKDSLPVIVAGDFNDVAWSQTSRMFKDNSKLLDTRVGRGLFNTFNAESHLMRWPLDHVYVSEAFKVIDLKRLDFIGSDHFPIYAELALMPE